MQPRTLQEAAREKKGGGRVFILEFVAIGTKGSRRMQALVERGLALEEAEK